ncbi:hypothetical protein SPONL_1543 [uncultured Candidatus Thioglobus sp.]|nr:hypothetical protein SPONL_1543 [uncultured Candidatus Thioglobus sp.]
MRYLLYTLRAVSGVDLRYLLYTLRAVSGCGVTIQFEKYKELINNSRNKTNSKNVRCNTLLFCVIDILSNTGSAMMSMQYEPMVSRYGSLPIAVASSSISRGKSNCGKVAIAACGNYPKGYTCYLTDSMARGHLSGGVPFLYDDPSMDSVLKPLLMHSFGGGEMGTRKIQFSARCTPIVTCNEFVIEKLATADERL